MHEIKDIYDELVEQVKNQLHNGVEKCDTKEMGEVIDMIKDLSMAMYYLKFVDKMHKENGDTSTMLKA